MEVDRPCRHLSEDPQCHRIWPDDGSEHVNQGSQTPISFDEFKRFLAEVLLIEEEKLSPEASLVNDLYVDSLRWVEMALRVEQLGVQMPTEAFWDIHTVGDAYEAYVKHLAIR
jgi:acyl carrier protein